MLKINDNAPVTNVAGGRSQNRPRHFNLSLKRQKDKCLCSLKDLFVVLYHRPGVSQHCGTNCVRISCGYNGCSCLALYKQNKALMLLIRVKTTQPQTIFEGRGALEIDSDAEVSEMVTRKDFLYLPTAQLPVSSE